MQNYFLIETEVTHRRREWERAVATAEQRARARPQNGRERRSRLVHVTLTYLRSLATPRLPVPSWNLAGVKCAETLEGGRASAM